MPSSVSCGKQGISAYASLWTEYGPVIVQKIDGERLTPVSIRVGHIMPLLTSATGRVFLAFMPPAQTQALVRKELLVLSEIKAGRSHIESTEDVAELAQRIRTAGLAETDSLLYTGFFGISAPILNYNDEICCALTILGPRGLFTVLSAGHPHRCSARCGRPQCAVRRARDTCKGIRSI